MRLCLQEGYVLELNKEIYEIKEVLGVGASSIVYLSVRLSDNSKHVLKEYNPNNIEIERDEKGSFIIERISVTKKEKFQEGLKRFCEGGLTQNKLRNEHDSAMNYITNVNQVIIGPNNSAYIDMTAFYGDSYEKCDIEESLYKLLVHLRAITVAVRSFHEQGYLHLDIKPSNIFILKDVSDLVFLYDFDSVVKKEDITKGDTSYSANWAAPEQIDPMRYCQIGENSDIYAIGEILFFRLFGRHSNFAERRVFSNYKYDEVKLLKDVSIKAKRSISQILHKTICNNEKKRYKTCDELINDLDEAIKCADVNKLHINSIIPPCNSEFSGRTEEMVCLKNMLDQHRIVSIVGMGGIGKTEFVKNYIEKNSKQYDSVIYLIGDMPWRDIINISAAKNIVNWEYDETESDDELFERVIHSLKSVLTGDSIIVIDNANNKLFEEEESEYRNAVFSLPCKFLITSRSVIDSFPHLELLPIEHEELVKLFFRWSELEKSEVADVEELLEYIGFHTLTSELVAKYIRNECLSAKEMLDQLVAVGLPKISGDISSVKDSTLYHGTLFEYLTRIFSLNSLPEEQAWILEIASLLPTSGINIKDFKTLVNLDSLNSLNRLIENSWVKRLQNTIYVHPMVSETVLATVGNLKYGNIFYQGILRELDKKEHCIETHIPLELLIDSCIRKTLKVDWECYDETFLKLMSIPADTSVILFHSYSKAIEYNSELVSLFERGKIPISEIIIDAYLNLAGMAEDLSEYDESIKYIEIVRGLIAENKFERQMEYEGNINLILACYYNDTNQMKKAEDAILEAIAKIPNSAENLLAEVFNQAGAIYNSLFDSEKSEKYYLLGLEGYRKIYGEQSWQVGVLYSNLGMFYSWDEQHDKAIEMLEKGLNIKKDIVNTDMHRSMMWTYACISTSQAELGILEDALINVSKAVDISIKDRGLDDICTGRLYAYKAAILLKLKKYDEADMYAQKAEMVLSRLGAMLEVASSLSRYARAAEANCDYEIARTYYSKCIDAFPEDCDDCLITRLGDMYRRLGRCNSVLKDYDEAEKCYQKAYKIFVEAYGEDNEFSIEISEELRKLCAINVQD